jgi:Fe-S cluster assembly protein SufB
LDDVPKEIKQTFERLGIPESERKFLAGVEAQFDSEAVTTITGRVAAGIAPQGPAFPQFSGPGPARFKE